MKQKMTLPSINEKKTAPRELLDFEPTETPDLLYPTATKKPGFT